jgi:hypothetical protein
LVADREGERGEGEKVLNVVSGLLSKLNEAKIENGKKGGEMTPTRASTS